MLPSVIALAEFYFFSCGFGGGGFTLDPPLGGCFGAADVVG
jgi:hypothetical protein